MLLYCILNSLFFGIQNANISNKNAIIWHFKCQDLVFIKLTPGVTVGLDIQAQGMIWKANKKSIIQFSDNTGQISYSDRHCNHIGT